MEPPWSNKSDWLSAGTFSAPLFTINTDTSNQNNKHSLSSAKKDVNVGDSSDDGNKKPSMSSGSSANKIPRVQAKGDATKKTKNDPPTALQPAGSMSPRRKKAIKIPPAPPNPEIKDTITKDVETKFLKDLDKSKPYNPDEVRSYMEKQKRDRKLKEMENVQNRQKEIEMKKKHLEELNEKARKLRLRTSSFNPKPATSASEKKKNSEILEAASDFQKSRKKQLNFTSGTTKVRNLPSNAIINSVKENQVPPLTNKNKRVNLILKEFEEIVIKECRKYLSKSDHSIRTNYKPSSQATFTRRPEPRRIQPVLVPTKCDKAVETTLSLEDPEVDDEEEDVSFSSISTVKSFSQVKDRLDRAAKLIQATYRGYKIRKILRDCQLGRSVYRPPPAAYSSDAFRVRILDLKNNKKVSFRRGPGSPRPSSASNENVSQRRMEAQVPLSPKPTSANLTDSPLGIYVPPPMPFYDWKSTRAPHLMNLNFLMGDSGSAHKLHKVVNEPYPAEALKRLKDKDSKETTLYQKISRAGSNNRTQQVIQPSVTDALLEKLRLLAEEEKRKAQIRREKNDLRKHHVDQKENTYESDFESVSSITRHSPEAGENVPSQDTSITDDYFGPSDDLERRNSSTPIPPDSPVKKKPVRVPSIDRKNNISYESSLQSTTVETDADLERNINSKRLFKISKDETINTDDLVSSVSTSSLDLQNLPMPVLQLKLSAERERLSILDKALQVIIQNCPSQSSDKLDRSEIVKIAKAAVDEHIKRKLSEFEVSSGEIPPKQRLASSVTVGDSEVDKIDPATTELEDFAPPEIQLENNSIDKNEEIVNLGHDNFNTPSVFVGDSEDDKIEPSTRVLDKNFVASEIQLENNLIDKKEEIVNQVQDNNNTRKGVEDSDVDTVEPRITVRDEDFVASEIQLENNLIDKKEDIVNQREDNNKLITVFGDSEVTEVDKIDSGTTELDEDFVVSEIQLQNSSTDKNEEIVHQRQDGNNTTSPLVADYADSDDDKIEPISTLLGKDFVASDIQPENNIIEKTEDVIIQGNENDSATSVLDLGTSELDEDSIASKIHPEYNAVDKTAEIVSQGKDDDNTISVIDPGTTDELDEDFVASDIKPEINSIDKNEEITNQGQDNDNTVSVIVEDSEVDKIDPGITELEDFVPSEVQLESNSTDKTEEIVSQVQDNDNTISVLDPGTTELDGEFASPKIQSEKSSIDKNEIVVNEGQDNDNTVSVNVGDSEVDKIDPGTKELDKDPLPSEIQQENNSVDKNEELINQGQDDDNTVSVIVGDSEHDKVEPRNGELEDFVESEIQPVNNSIDKNEEIINQGQNDDNTRSVIVGDSEDGKINVETSELDEDFVASEIQPENNSIDKNEEIFNKSQASDFGDTLCLEKMHQDKEIITAEEQKSVNLSVNQLDSSEKGASSLIAVYLSALELREKPPPPYSPPSSESLSCSFRSFFINLEMETLRSTVKSFVGKMWNDWTTEKTIPNVKVDSVFCAPRPPNQSSSFDDKFKDESASAAEWAHYSFDLLMTDMLQDITQSILQAPTKNLVDFVRKGPIAIETQRLKAPKTQEELVSAIVNTSLKVIPKFILPNEDVSPSVPLKWSCRARDLVDELLVEEMIEDEPLWSDLWPEELLVKDELSNKIVEDCVRSVISDLKIVFGL